MRIEVSNVRARLVEAAPHEVAWVGEYLTYEDTRARYARASGDGATRLLNTFDLSFPSGFVRSLERAARDAGLAVVIEDQRQRPCEPDPAADLGWLRDYQREAVDKALAATRGILWLPTGAGKCLGMGTPVLLYDGRIVPVEAVQTGDLLMGPDSQPRRVLSTTRGYGPLYRIVPHRGTPWVCNDVHVLTLVHTETGAIVDVPLNDYQQRTKWFRHLHKQFGTSVDFPAQSEPLPIDPYFLGVWFGDGKKDLKGIWVSKPDPEIRQLMIDTAEAWGLRFVEDLYEGKCPTYRLSRRSAAESNPLLAALRQVVGKPTELPHRYLTASRVNREALLAGLLDTDGYVTQGHIEVVQRERGIADGIAFLARSLGLRAVLREKLVNGTSYWRVNIAGDVSGLPLRIPRKRTRPRKCPKSPTRTGFAVEPIGVGDYYGFTLDGDGRFLLGDFTVTHNTELAAALAKTLRCSWLFIVPQADLLGQTGERFTRRTGEPAGIVGDGEWHEERFTVATFQTLAAAISGRSSAAKARAAADLLARVEGVIIDECHTLPADSVLAVVSKTRRAYWRFGLSGTPLARGDRRSLLAIGALGGIIHRIKPDVLIAAGALSRPTIRVVPVVQASSRPTWQGAHGDLVVRSKQRNATVVNICKVAAAPGFVFVTHVKHGKVLTKMLGDAGLRVEFVWGAHSTEFRSRIIERLVTGKLDFVVCSSVFQQAIDVPQLRSVINAAGGASAIATIQRIGRGTRVTEDKKTFEAWDIIDRGNRWLERHTRERIRAYEGEGYQPQLAPEYSAPNEQGLVPDPESVNAEAEYRKAQKVARDALKALTGETSVRRRR